MLRHAPALLRRDAQARAGAAGRLREDRSGFSNARTESPPLLVLPTGPAIEAIF